jgi:predicted neuraminidase
MKLILIILVLFSGCSSLHLNKTSRLPNSESASEAVYDETFLVTPGEFKLSHSATIQDLPNGDLLACWYSSPEIGKEAAVDVQIYCRRKNHDQIIWQEKTLVVKAHETANISDPSSSIGNPTLYNDGQTVWLFYTAIKAPNVIGKLFWSSKIEYKTSIDNGRTWSVAKSLRPDHEGELPRGRILGISPGHFLLPLYHERDFRTGFICDIKTTLDQISNLACTDFDGGPHSQPTLMEINNGQHAYFRAQKGGKLLHASRKSMSEPWTEVLPLELPNPDSSAAAESTNNLNGLLVYNDSSTAREPLVLSHSTDGINFKIIKILDGMYNNPAGSKEYSYPQILRDQKGEYHVVYTYDWRHAIKYIHFNEAWLQSKI